MYLALSSFLLSFITPDYPSYSFLLTFFDLFFYLFSFMIVSLFLVARCMTDDELDLDRSHSYRINAILQVHLQPPEHSIFYSKREMFKLLFSTNTIRVS